MAYRQRFTRRGPTDVKHYSGESNKMADIPSRSFGPTPISDDKFLRDFAARFPLPPQLGSWSFACPSNGIISAAFSLLRKQVTYKRMSIGKIGSDLPPVLASTLTSEPSRALHGPTLWGASTCSWPLLDPSGAVSTTMANDLANRRSRIGFESAPKSWAQEDLRTLTEAITPSLP